MSESQSKTFPDHNEESGTNIERCFRMFSGAAIAPKPYKKTKLPQSVTAYLDPGDIETLHVLSCRLGATRGQVAALVLKLGLAEAAAGCGFDLDEEGRILEEEKGKWNVTPRQYGIGFTSTVEED